MLSCVACACGSTARDRFRERVRAHGGQLIQRPYIVARDQGASAPLGGAFPGQLGRSAWLFGDTFLAAGFAGADCEHLARDSQAVSRRPGADGISVGADYADATGAPTEFLPLSPAEGLYNAAHEPLRGTACATTTSCRRPAG